MKTQTPSTTKSSYSSADLAERAVQRRAVVAAIWGMPAVNYHLVYQEPGFYLPTHLQVGKYQSAVNIADKFPEDGQNLVPMMGV